MGTLSVQALADSALVTNSANGHTYKRYDSNVSWQQAKTACASRGAHLITITDQSEQDFYAQILRKPESELTVPNDGVLWLGATDEAQEGVWKWVTGELFVFQNWYPGEPNNFFNGENYMVSGGPDSAGQPFGSGWNDAGATSAPTPQTFKFICEWERLYESVATLSDITGDAIPDYATIYREAGNIYLLTSNGASGAPIKRVLLGSESSISAASFSAVAGDISVLLSRSNGSAVIQVRDEVTLAATAAINLR